MGVSPGFLLGYSHRCGISDQVAIDRFKRKSWSTDSFWAMAHPTSVYLFGDDTGPMSTSKIAGLCRFQNQHFHFEKSRKKLGGVIWMTWTFWTLVCQPQRIPSNIKHSHLMAPNMWTHLLLNHILGGCLIWTGDVVMTIIPLFSTILPIMVNIC